MEYVMHVTVDDSLFDGDDSIEVAAKMLQDALRFAGPECFIGSPIPTVRPLSEVLAC